MISDLYVDGNSYASGWGRGLQTAILKQPDFESWVDYFADLSNCENVWNHSLVAKPIDMQKYDVINFCNEYYKKHNSFDRLFVIVELPFVWYRILHNLRIRENNFKGETAYPIIMSKWIHLDTLDYMIHYVRRSGDYLTIKEPLFSTISRQQLDLNDVAKTEKLAEQWMNERPRRFTEHMTFAYENVHHIKQFLHQRNIPYMIYSSVVTEKNPYRDSIDFAFRNFYKDNRFVPIKEMTGTQIGTKASLETFRDHPDKTGHKAIATWLFEYLTKHNLTEKPNSSLII
jgi:hypothetical protein